MKVVGTIVNPGVKYKPARADDPAIHMTEFKVQIRGKAAYDKVCNLVGSGVEFEMTPNQKSMQFPPDGSTEKNGDKKKP